jgi:hypothetical protein
MQPTMKGDTLRPESPSLEQDGQNVCVQIGKFYHAVPHVSHFACSRRDGHLSGCVKLVDVNWIALACAEETVAFGKRHERTGKFLHIQQYFWIVIVSMLHVSGRILETFLPEPNSCHMTNPTCSNSLLPTPDPADASPI